MNQMESNEMNKERKMNEGEKKKGYFDGRRESPGANEHHRESAIIRKERTNSTLRGV